MKHVNIDRRDWLRKAAALASTCLISATDTPGQERVVGQRPKRISSLGCGRATGYAEANKIVSFDGRTHVAWLDSPQDGFRVRIRTLDRNSGQWSPTYTVGTAYDNHGGPALTIDSEGYLHIVYFPHHHPMRYRKSKRPNDASEWHEEVRIGERLTYPTLVCGNDDSLYLTARRRFDDRPWQVELWKRPAGKQWQLEGAILQSRHNGYSHFQESLAWGPDHQTLHLCCRFHEKSDKEAYGRLQTVAYLMSPDAGRTWQKSDGTSVVAPATAESADVLARGGVDHGKTLRAGALAVDHLGRPHLLYCTSPNDQQTRLWIARSDGNGTWHRTDLTKHLPENLTSWNLTGPSGIAINPRGELLVVATAQRADDGNPSWGHASNEVVLFRHDPRSDRRDPSFSCELVSSPSPTTSNWLPNIERPTGHRRAALPTGLIYTAGGPGTKNTDLLSNEVYFTQV